MANTIKVDVVSGRGVDLLGRGALCRACPVKLVSSAFIRVTHR